LRCKCGKLRFYVTVEPVERKLHTRTGRRLRIVAECCFCHYHTRLKSGGAAKPRYA
jgi:hypothetical protein